MVNVNGAYFHKDDVPNVALTADSEDEEMVVADVVARVGGTSSGAHCRRRQKRR
ncbi:unnamed protein product, partial [Sphenostylis stenocarpa]